MKHGPVVRIIIVNWNTGDQLRECMKSIGRCVERGYDLETVVIVDNHSSDDSCAGILREGAKAITIPNRCNRGFAAACNQGAQGSEADYLLFLNPDMLLNSDSLSVPVQYLSAPENGDVGICGIQLVDQDGAIQRSCSRFPTPRMFLAGGVGLDRLAGFRHLQPFMVEWDHARSAEVDHVIGAFFMVRRSLFEALGGFDERFFVYYEEVDFALRARKAGWRCFYLAEACACHHGQGSSESVRGDRLFYILRSRVLFAFKHFGRCRALGVVLGALFPEFVARLLGSGLERSWQGVGETLEGYAKLWKYLLSHAGSDLKCGFSR